MAKKATIKHVMFADLPVHDQGRAIDFYSQKLGFRVATDAPYVDDWRWVELEIPGAATRILLTRAEDASTPAGEERTTPPALVFAVDDTDAAFAMLRDAGVEPVSEPATPPWNPGGRFALLRDSEGNVLLIQS